MTDSDKELCIYHFDIVKDYCSKEELHIINQWLIDGNEDYRVIAKGALRQAWIKKSSDSLQRSLKEWSDEIVAGMLQDSIKRKEIGE